MICDSKFAFAAINSLFSSIASLRRSLYNGTATGNIKSIKTASFTLTKNVAKTMIAPVITSSNAISGTIFINITASPTLLERMAFRSPVL